jgi:GAF domain-containing protein/HAMP domain-containing protein
MILARKLLNPILFLFAIALTGLLAYAYSSYQSQYNQQEEQNLNALNEIFLSEINSLQKLALGLAAEIAGNPAAQEAFAAQNRQRLTELTLPGFEKLQEFDVAQFQFYLPPATSFLRLHSLQNYGDDLSSFRPTVILANASQKPVSGLESGRGGLGMRGIAPVYFQGRYIGSVEIGISVGQPLLDSLKKNHGGDWRILLTRESMVNALPEEITKLPQGPTSSLLLLGSTQEETFFGEAESYESALNGTPQVYRAVVNDKSYVILSSPLYDYSGKIIGIVDIIQDRTAFAAAQDSRLAAVGVAGFITLFFSILIVALFTIQTLRPIQKLTHAAADIASGDFSREVKINSKDEIGALASEFNDMTAQLRELVGELEKRVADRTLELERRTLELEVISEVGHEITTVRDVDTLLNLAASLIRERFGYYHVGIFLIDDHGEYAVLRAASSDAAQKMLEQNHRLKVGETGIVGYVAGTGLPRIALDVGADAIHFRNPLLPETHSEIALPMRSQSLTMGVLDIQVTESSAFDQRDIKTLQFLADQLVAAIENARLVQRAENALNELNRAYQVQTQQSWKKEIQDRGRVAFEYDGAQMKSLVNQLPASLIRQLERGRAVALNARLGKDPEYKSYSPNTLIVPLVVLNQIVGVIGLEQEDPEHVWAPDEISIVEAAASRAALALENARLLEESQRRARKEHAISEATARISSVLDVENILYTTAEELERILGGSEITLQFHTDGDESGKR